MRKFFFTATILVILFIQFPVFGQPFTLVKDINAGSLNSCLGTRPQPLNLTEAGGSLFFTVNNTYSGGLWKTDGTTTGTLRVKELTGIQTLVKINDLLFFNAYDANTSTQQLWKSDGTEAGTVIVKTWPNYRIDNLVSSNGILYFIYQENANELWKSDGTEAGTIPLKSFSTIQHLTDVGGTLFFSVNENIPPYRYTLWKSNGTVAGTVLVKDIYAGSGFTSYDNFYNVNGTLFFVGSDGVNGAELWKSDGTDAGTIMIKDIEPDFAGSNIRSFATANNIVYFFTSTTANGISLWKSDGTTPGTVLVKDLNDDRSPDYLTNVNGTLFFKGYDDINGEELWKSNGTDAGTVLVKNIFPGSEGGNPTSLISVNGILFFSAKNEADPLPGTGPFDCFSSGELWKSDGTDAGTVLVKNIFPGIGGSAPQGFVQANGLLFFKANNGINGRELWKSDGTANGTLLVKDIFTTQGSSPQKFTAMNGRVYFTAFNGDAGPAFGRGREVYQTDGTLSGTAQSTWIFTLGGSSPREIANLNGELFISATNGSHGHELWKTDGLGLYTGGTTIWVKDINSNFGSVERGSNPSHFTSINQFLFFSATDGTNGYELWKSDGTSDGTVMVKNINPGAGDSNPVNLLNVNGILYFTADNGTDGIELWKSDGTDAGTVMIKNINAGSNSSSPGYLTAINAVLYFAANDGVNGIELWKSDGTEAGTVLVKNINAAGNSSNPASITNVNGVLYFSADNGINGVEVWKSNGTDAGTVLVKDIYSGPASSSPGLFTNLNGIVLFAADDGIAGRELWGSNGNATGTILIKDIQPGTTGSNPTALKRVGSNVFFAANDGVTGNEVWLSNGAELGTRLVSEIEPGITGSDPTEIFEYGAKVLVSATNTMFGSEVWIVDAPAGIPVLNATITAAGPLTICNGNNLLLKANTGVGYTYQWKKSGINIGGATQSNYSATLSGTYAVTVTDAFGLTATSQDAIVTVATYPLATVAAAGPLSLCAGKNVLLKAITGTGYTYQWRKSGVNIDNATQSNYTATAAGAYSVVVANATGCSTPSVVINVTVNTVPLATVAVAGPLTFCEGRNVQLKAITGTGYTYQWKRGGADIAGATLSNYTAVSTGIHTVIVTNANGCAATSAAFNVVVKPLPLATITPAGSTTFCSDKNVLLKANTGTNYTYQWIRGAVAVPGAVQSAYAANTPGQYTVIVTNASGCSVPSAAIPVTVNPLPVALITPAGPLTFCAGQNVPLKANTGTNYTYQWKKSGINIPNATQGNFTASVSGVYSVIVTNAAGCPVTSSGVTVNVNNAPLATIAAAGATSFCAGKNVLLKAINGTGYTYQWKKNGISIPQEITSAYTAAAAGIYSVVVTNTSGCSTTSTGIAVAVTPAPLATVAVAGPLTFCEGRNVLLKAIAGTGYTYQWKKNGINIPTQSQSTYTATATGVYTVAVTNAEGCSTISTAINVTVTPAPVTTITANGPLTFSQGGNVILSAAPATGNNYQWKKDGVNIVGATSESYTATASGSYAVVITSSNGCQATSQTTVISVTSTRPLITKSFVGEEDFIKVYPNPLYRSNYINIEWGITAADKGILVTVSDMAGRKISSQRLKSYEKTIKITGASGMYIVELRWGNNKRKIFTVIKIE